MYKQTLQKLGYFISVFGVSIILIWIGIFKFTTTEANAIVPLIQNSNLMSWLYKIATIQTVSNIIGAFEIMTRLCLLLHFWWKKAGIVGGLFSVLTFLVTLSFLVSTPGVFKIIDGVFITDFFILKDIMALGISMLIWSNSLPKGDIVDL